MIAGISEERLSRRGFRLIPPGYPRPDYLGRASSRVWHLHEKNLEMETMFIAVLMEVPNRNFNVHSEPMTYDFVLRACLEGKPNRVVWVDQELDPEDEGALGGALSMLQSIYVVHDFETREAYRRRHPDQ